jgi:serine/threonine protein kinase
VKVVDREVFKTSDQLLLLDNEIRCQKACNSGYTVKLFDTFDTSSFRFIITEFCEGGDLYRCLRGTTNGLPEPVVVQFAREIALALKQLKDANIIHRDIKSENVLIQKNGCKLGDFGFAI